MLTREYYGMPLTWQRITPGNTPTAISQYVYRYQELTIQFQDGNNGAIPAVGSIFKGNSTGATAIAVTTATLSSGSWSGNNAAGTIRVKSYAGTFNANESLNIGGTFSCNMVGSPKYYAGGYKFKNMEAKAVLLQAENNAQRILFDYHGAIPDQDSDLGLLLGANSSIVINDPWAIRNVKTVDAVFGSAGSLNTIGYF